MLRLLLMIAFSLLLQACVGKPSQPAEFYVLSTQPAVETMETGGKPLAIGLGPLLLPDLLDRPQIVTRTHSNQVVLSEYHRWGGELEQELMRVLALNLMNRLGTQQIAFYPWSSQLPLDFQLSLRLFRLEGSPGRQAELEGIWRLLDGRGRCEKQVQHFHYLQETAASGYPGLVAAMSLAVGRLSEDLASAVRQAQPGCPQAQ